MEETEPNLKALYFSPQFWWEAIEGSIYLTENFGKELLPNFDYRKWLKEDTIENDSIQLYEDDEVNIRFKNYEYSNAAENEYFFKVCATNKYGHKVAEYSIDELNKKHDLPETPNYFYSFKIKDLNHFASMYFQNWLLFDTYRDWVRWQLYYDFIISKLDGTLKGLYQYMWSVILEDVNLQHHLFKDVKQYKKFRDKHDDIKVNSSYIVDKVIKLRQSLD